MICPNCGNQNLVQDEVTLDFICSRCKTRVPEKAIEKIDFELEESNVETNFNYLKTIKSVILLNAEDSVGTGFIISKEGLVLTNSHVLNKLDYCYGIIGDSPDVYELELVYNGSNEDIDLCLLRIIDTEETFVPLEINSNESKIGDNLFTIGNPKGLGLSLTKGTLSRIHKSGNLQLDMTINPGNSGGPVLNEKGNICGVVTHILEEVQGLGFALSILKINEFLKIIKDGGFDV